MNLRRFGMPVLGLFLPARFISILLFFSTGIISAGRIHLYLVLSCHRDYFGQPDSSLSCSFSSQGLFRPPGFISILLFFSAGIISTVLIHLCLPLFHHRDYFSRSDTSPIAENISARPFRQLPTCLIINAAMICSFLLYFESKPFYIKRLPYIAKTMYRSLFCQNHVQLFSGSRIIVPAFLVSFRSMIL